ncbi:MAG: phosphatase PAP2 family protein [bacterium]
MPGLATRSRRTVVAAIALVSSLTATLGAQVTTGADGRTVTPRDTSHAAAHKTLFTYRDAMLAGAFVGLTFAMFPADRHIAESLQDDDIQNNKLFDNPTRNVELITAPGAYIIGAGLYAIGKLGGHKDVADLGWHGTEAVIVASGVTNILKGTLGRARPYVTGDTNPRNFSFGRGFGRGTRATDVKGILYGTGDYQSFPSGHTSTAFAAASAVTSEARRMWPKSVWYVAPVMYGGATLVGLSRMYHNNHWASDVALGAAIGTFSGLKVVRYSHAHPDNKLDHFILGASIFPSPGGGTLSFNFPAPNGPLR